MKTAYLKEKIKKTGLVSVGKYKANELRNLNSKINDYIFSINKGNIDYKLLTNVNSDKSITLTEEQFKMVTTEINGDSINNNVIIACAGSGKTTSIIGRIKYLVDNGIKPYRIMLTTFNVDAAKNMKDKLFDVFGFDINIYIGTLDALSFRFYNAYSKRDDFVGVEEYCTEFLKFLKSDNEKSQKLKDRLQYVFFDEFQDCNDIQFEIIREFAKKSNVTVIGDDSQNIYQWRGSNIDYILNFNNYIKEKCNILSLCENFRSTPEIVNLANTSISNNTDHFPKEMRYVKQSCNIKPLIIKYKNDDEQTKGILSQIIKHLQNGIKIDEIVVLARNNHVLKKMEENIEIHNKNTKGTKLKYVSLIEGDKIKDNKPIILKNHITLTTIHRAKGLEWDVVFLLGCNDESFPSETTDIKIQEDRRLFYVAVTRAKKYLYISFTSSTITRFIGELDANLYDFPSKKQSYFNYNDSRNIKFKTGVTKLIENIGPHEIETMRKTGLLPELIPVTKKIHNDHKYSKLIDDYNLQADFGTFIDRYITRQLGFVVPNCGGLDDIAARRVLHTVTLPLDLHKSYMKHNYIIQRYIDKLNSEYSSNIHLITTEMIKICINTEIFNKRHKCDNNCKVMITKLIIILINKSKEYKIDPSLIHITPKNYLPNEFQERFNLAYQKYCSNIDSKQILKSIFDVSLCQGVVDNRRRLLYRDDCFDIFNMENVFYDDINTWIKTFRNKNIIAKKLLNDVNRNINGEADLINITNNTIIDFKCSVNTECSLDWILQLLTYISIYFIETNIKITNFMFYNPLRGTITYLELPLEWNLHEKYLDFIDQVRISKLLN